LQINLAPNDFPHAKYILPHQISSLIDQVDEVVLILDTHRSKGRFGVNWEENLSNIKQLINEQLVSHEKIRITQVDYSPETVKMVARFFFGKNSIPKKDYRGGPFYAYFFGLYDCQSNYVLHLDSDIFLGGASQVWIATALDLFDKNKNLLICSPLPGPPHPDHILIGQPGAVKLAEDYHFRFASMSTRIFMISKFFFQNNKLKLTSLTLKNKIKAIAKGNQTYDLPEHIISAYMHKNKLYRIDFLGEMPGLWSLHPPYRTEDFYKQLPNIIQQIKLNNLPKLQYGYYDIVDGFCDWTLAKAKLRTNRWWKS
jgi:hypothetical protein